MKKNLVLIPGLLGNEILWRRTADVILSHGVADIFMHGVVEGKGVEDAAEKVWEAVDEMFGGEKVVVVGHSYGGYVALEMAKQKPEGVEGMGLVSSQLKGDSKVMVNRRKQLLEAAISTPHVIELQKDGLLHPDNHHLVPTLHEMAGVVPLATFHDQQTSAYTRPTTHPTHLPPFPVFLSTGDSDRAIPKLVFDTMHAAFHPTHPTTTHTIADTGHMAPLESPESLGVAISEWLKSI